MWLYKMGTGFSIGIANTPAAKIPPKLGVLGGTNYHVVPLFTSSDSLLLPCSVQTSAAVFCPHLRSHCRSIRCWKTAVSAYLDAKRREVYIYEVCIHMPSRILLGYVHLFAIHRHFVIRQQ